MPWPSLISTMVRHGATTFLLVFFLSLSMTTTTTTTTTLVQAAVMPVATFDSGSRPNERGGWYNPFQGGGPSTAYLEHSTVEHRGQVGQSIWIRADKNATGGWCGVWMLLTGDLDKDNVLDTQRFSHVTFFIKGSTTIGPSDFVVKMTDLAYPDGRILGPVGAYLTDTGADPDGWHQVLIPLTDANTQNLDRTAITTLSIEFIAFGLHEFYLDDVYFLTDASEIVPASGPQNPLVVDTFDDTNVNALGGYFRALERAPSTARVTKEWNIYRGQGGKSWQINGTKANAGWCGAWMNLLDFEAFPRIYLDTTNYAYLTFWVRGAVGGESVSIKFADRHWMEVVDDAVSVGPITDFLSGGVTTSWQQVKVPLSLVEGTLDLNHLGSLVFEFDYIGDLQEQVVYVDDVYFISNHGDTIDESTSHANIFDRSPPKRSLWVWKGQALLEQRIKQNQLWNLCTRENVGTLWFALPVAESLITGDGNLPDPFVFSSVWNANEKQLRRFLQAAHKRGLQVHALSGSPAWAQVDYHHVSLGIVDGVIAFNAATNNAAERFDGVHMDNEPYLLPAWNTNMRETILRDFLGLNMECQQRCKTAGISFGVDIPFWLGAPDPKTGEAMGVVTYGSQRKSIDKFLIDFLDNVGIMNYHDKVYGWDSMLYHGESILKYAEDVGNFNVLMGLETYLPDPVDTHFPVGLPYSAFDSAMALDTAGIASNTFYLGYRMAILDDGENIHIGLERPEGLTTVQTQDFDVTLQQLAQDMGGCENDTSLYDDVAMLVTAADAIDANSQFVEFEQIATTGCRSGFRTQHIGTGQFTFGDESCSFLRAEMTKADQEFAQASIAYGGQAVHSFTSFKKLCPN